VNADAIADGGGSLGEPAECSLAQLAPGERGLILRIDADPGITRRLMELGLVPGTEVELVRLAPLGDPLEVVVRGLHLSLRRSEAGHIHVAHG
jgi:ferrous iron transport protein A